MEPFVTSIKINQVFKGRFAVNEDMLENGGLIAMKKSLQIMFNYQAIKGSR